VLWTPIGFGRFDTSSTVTFSMRGRRPLAA
jgi:hypothetical protein